MYEVFEQLLQKYGVTPYKVAKETGVTQTALSNWKAGRSTPSTKTLQKVADYFGVTLDYLTTGNEDSNILIRDSELEEIDKTLELAGYSLCCENYDDDFFTIKNAYGQTVANFHDYELLARYKALKKKNKLTAKLLISSETAFFKYLESLGYYIGSDDPEHKSFIQYDNGAVQMDINEFNEIRTRIDTYTKATLDSFILRLNEDGIRRKRIEKEKVIKQLQGSQFEKDWNKAHLEPVAAHDRTDISDSDRTDAARKTEDDIMDDPNF